MALIDDRSRRREYLRTEIAELMRDGHYGRVGGLLPGACEPCARLIRLEADLAAMGGEPAETETELRAAWGDR